MSFISASALSGEFTTPRIRTLTVRNSPHSNPTTSATTKDAATTAKRIYSHRSGASFIVCVNSFSNTAIILFSFTVKDKPPYAA